MEIAIVNSKSSLESGLNRNRCPNLLESEFVGIRIWIINDSIRQSASPKLTLQASTLHPGTLPTPLVPNLCFQEKIIQNNKKCE